MRDLASDLSDELSRFVHLHSGRNTADEDNVRDSEGAGEEKESSRNIARHEATAGEGGGFSRYCEKIAQ